MWKKTLASLSFAVLLAASTVFALASSASTTTTRLLTAHAAAGAREVKLFLVALDDNGRAGKKIGCNDSLVSITREVSPTRAPMRAALEELLKFPQKGGPQDSLHNALYGSKLKLGRVYVRGGEAVIQLSGQLTTGGVCDAPRVRGQIEATAQQFPGVRRVKVYVNGKSLSSYLSERD